MSNAAEGQPAGGSVVAGQAQISSAGATTLINQSSSKAIINWQSFSVGQGGTVQFNQPNSSAITLNRVTGTSASAIDGAIRANGQVWLLNPNGLLFGNGATVNVGGLLATTSDINDQDFLAGRYNFSSTNGKGGITNAGTIKASNGGSVVLSSPNVVNKGLIQADAGHVVLGGTDTFTVDFQGDHLLSYAVGANSTGGKVTNSGTLAAAGGKILMTARAAAGVQDAVINNTGMVEATSVREENGEIILEADNGTVSNSGTLDASGKASGETGGTVKVLGQQVAVTDGANIDVSGDAGGGTALIGGNLHGAGPEPNAQNTTVGKATINANANTSGDGGTVVVYSTGTTQVAATVTAKGGIISGKGGMVETSGHTLGVATAASISTAAPHGTPGDWLLDPDTIIIATGGGGSDTGQNFGSTGSVTIDPTTIDASLVAGSNVTLQANLDITVSNAVSAVSSANTLELDAGRSIVLNAGLQIASGSIVLSAGDSRSAAAGTFLAGSKPGAAITQIAGASIAATNLTVANGTLGGTISLTAANSFSTLTLATNNGDAAIAAAGSVAIGTTGLGTGAFSLTAGGPVTQVPSASLVAGDLTIAAPGSAITLTNTVTNGVIGTARFTAGGNVSFNNSNATTLGASTLTGTNTTLTVVSGGTLSLTDTSGSITAPNVSLQANGRITQAFVGASLPINSTTFSATATGSGGALLLSPPSGPGNNITGTITLSADPANGILFANTTTTNLAAIGPVDDMTINATGATSDINVGGTLQATGFAGITLNAGGGINFSGGSGLIASAVSLTSGTGGIGGSFPNALPVSAASGAVSLTLSNSSTTGSGTYITSTSPVTVTSATGVSSTSGTFDLETSAAAADLTLNSAISVSAPVVLFSGGNLILNQSVTATGNTVYLKANAAGAAASPASITGTGTVTADDVAVLLVGDGTGTGSIGLPTAPLHISGPVTGPTGNVNIQLRTGSQSAYVSSASGVSITQIDSTLGITGVQLVGTNNSNPNNPVTVYGNFVLSAQGPVSQVQAISAQDLTVSTTGIGSDIVLSGNTINGIVRFGTDPGSNVSYTSASSVTLGNSNVGGALDIEATGSGQSIALNDTAGSVVVGGLLTLNSDSAISQTIPVTAGGLAASVGVTGGIFLQDPGNQISGNVTLQVPINSDGASLTTSQAITLGNSTIANAPLTIVSGPLTIAGNVVVSNGALSLTSSGAITQTGGAITQTLGETGVSLVAGSDITLNSTGNVFNGIFSVTAPGNIALTNNAPTFVYSINDNPLAGGPSYPLAANSVAIQVLGLGNPLIQETNGLGIAAHTISLSSMDGTLGNLNALPSAPLILSGGPDASNTPDAATLSLSVTSGGGNVFISSHSPVSIANGGVNLNGSGPFGGNFILSSYGSVAVNAPITTTGNIIGIDTGGSIQVNASITALQNISGPGAIVLNANDANLNFSAATSNGISGSGLLTAGIINLIANAGQTGQGGSIGAQTQAMQVTSDTGQLSLAVQTYNGNVYINSAVGITIDNQNSAIQSYGVVLGSGSGAVGINTESSSLVCGSGPCYGEVFLTAAGPVGQTWGIQSGILTVTSTGPNATILLTDTGFSPDLGNAVYGQLHLNSAGYAAFIGAGQTAVNLGASTVVGDLYVGSLSSNINVQDPAGGAVNVTGNALLSAAGNIEIQSPLIAGNSIQLSGAAIQQNPSSTTDAHIQAGGNLIASASALSISLNDLGHSCSGGSCVADAGNQIAGTISVYATAGSAIIANVPGIQFGPFLSNSSGSPSSPNSPASAVAGILDAITPGNITLLPGAFLAAGANVASGATSIILQAGGNFINNSGLGQATLTISNSGFFNIYSAGPANDVFGGLNSSNTAVWNTSYQAPVTVTGNRYIFAYQPSLTVTIGNQTKVYGTDDTSALQGLASALSGVQTGVAGVFLDDTAASIYSGTPTVASAGAAASANVGSYSITASLTLNDGYALAVTPGTLTVTPATLFYTAGSVTRAFGAANPAFAGTVTGFVNGDTQASATTGKLVFTTAATITSPSGSYAIDGSGLTATNYIFAQATGNATALTISAASALPGALASFTNSLQLPPLQSLANTPLGSFSLSSLPIAAPPPPPPPPPAPPLVLTDENAEQPNSSDQTTSEVANSLDGGGSDSQHGSVVIPQMLVNGTPPPPPPTDISSLSSFGNSSLWQ